MTFSFLGLFSMELVGWLVRRQEEMGGYIHKCVKLEWSIYNKYSFNQFCSDFMGKFCNISLVSKSTMRVLFEYILPPQPSTFLLFRIIVDLGYVLSKNSLLKNSLKYLKCHLYPLLHIVAQIIHSEVPSTCLHFENHLVFHFSTVTSH